MAKVPIFYHSLYGRIEPMAQAEAEAAREVPGAEVLVMRVPEPVASIAARLHG